MQIHPDRTAEIVLRPQQRSKNCLLCRPHGNKAHTAGLDQSGCRKGDRPGPGLPLLSVAMAAVVFFFFFFVFLSEKAVDRGREREKEREVSVTEQKYCIHRKHFQYTHVQGDGFG